MQLMLEHLPERSRFQATVDGSTCVVDYRLAHGVMTITHTGVPPAVQGRGIAAALVQSVLQHAQAGGFKVSPQCSYVAAYMRRHPETAVLMA